MQPFVFLLVTSAHHPTSVVRHIPCRLRVKSSDCRLIKLQRLWQNNFHGPWRTHELHSVSTFSRFYSFGITVWWVFWVLADPETDRRGHVQDKKVYFSLFKRSVCATGTWQAAQEENTRQVTRKDRWRVSGRDGTIWCHGEVESRVMKWLLMSVMKLRCVSLLQREATPTSTCTVKEQAREANQADTPARVQSLHRVRIFVIFKWEIFSLAVCWMKVITGVSLLLWIHE